MIEQFRKKIIDLSTFIEYVPVKTEIKGIGNTFSGIAQIVVGIFMKCHSNPKYYDTQSKKHIDRGYSTLKTGGKQCLPAFIVLASLYMLTRNLHNFKRKVRNLRIKND